MIVGVQSPSMQNKSMHFSLVCDITTKSATSTPSLTPVHPKVTTYLTGVAVVARFHVCAAVVTRVNKAALLALVVKLVKERHCRELGTTQRGELQMALSCHGQEGVATIHQVARNQRVWVCGRWQRWDGSGRV